ncbi:hypothetical protein PSTG_14024 [Puccinia striiformis f. sp. tritici PST-78]|uniref:Uncharacterized protein n=1 Tax=Puccinia striiformis f. sp. tritici PST-78 TaxID=1165861 RepID=A0A0L0V084_9BASI|nr:hypothetical protein PSTG_14024 [Puccinia striiformis f. sp. tritici PST-78]
MSAYNYVPTSFQTTCSSSEAGGQGLTCTLWSLSETAGPLSPVRKRCVVDSLQTFKQLGFGPKVGGEDIRMACRQQHRKGPSVHTGKIVLFGPYERRDLCDVACKPVCTADKDKFPFRRDRFLTKILRFTPCESENSALFGLQSYSQQSRTQRNSAGQQVAQAHVQHRGLSSTDDG